MPNSVELPNPPNRGAFQPGQSGNPAGRPKGARSRLALLTQQHLDGEATAIVTAVIAAAKAGEPTAMRLCIERLMPARKGAPVLLDLPTITAAADVPRAMAAVCEAVAEGEISPEEGAAVAGIVEASRKAIETADLEARIAALESKDER